MNIETPGHYGQNKLLKLYLNIKSLPEGVIIQHGWAAMDGVCNTDLNKCKHLMLAWNGRYKKEWDLKSNLPCQIIGSPYVHYRRLAKIEQSEKAKGTLAFPAHSIKQIEANYDLDKYCEKLNNLPEEFQPVTICLHHLDIKHYQLEAKFKERGFDVVCTTHKKKGPPAELFYTLIKNFKYTTSNEPGSYTFYSVEMNIPFFILGELAIRHNFTGTIIDIQEKIYSITDYKYGKIAYDLFSNQPKDRITEEQRAFVLSELGMLDCAPRSVLVDILNEIALKQKNTKDGYKILAKQIWRLIKHPRLFTEALKDSYLYNKHNS